MIVFQTNAANQGQNQSGNQTQEDFCRCPVLATCVVAALIISLVQYILTAIFYPFGYYWIDLLHTVVFKYILFGFHCNSNFWWYIHLCVNSPILFVLDHSSYIPNCTCCQLHLDFLDSWRCDTCLNLGEICLICRHLNSVHHFIQKTPKEQ